MSVNLTSFLSAKDREKIAAAKAQAANPNYFKLSLAERAELRQKIMNGAQVETKPIEQLTIPANVAIVPSKEFIAIEPESLAPSAQPINGNGSGKVDFMSLLAPKAKIVDTGPRLVIHQDTETTPTKDTKDTEPVAKPEVAKKETFSLLIELNDKQQMAADFSAAGKSFCLAGAAGTGKTTACREIAKRLLESGGLRTHNFKLRGGGGYIDRPSIAFCAYTNRAADNMRRALHKDSYLEKVLDMNVLTIHKLLEFEPEFFPREDGTTGMRFVPRRTSKDPLHITHLVMEESSMVGVDLASLLLDALPADCQIIYVGDINQLQPIFSKPVLSYALTSLPVVELTEVYRQALDNPIIENAHLCLAGKPLKNVAPHFKVIDGKKLKSIPSEAGVVQQLNNSLKKWYLDKTTMADGSRNYDPDLDIILCPFGKENKARGSQCNTTVVNNYIAQFLGQERNALVYEIIASMRKLYLAVGDRVMIDKQDGFITKISHNARYVGQMPKVASTELTRFGVRLLGQSKEGDKDEDFDALMEGYESLDVSAIPDEQDDKKKLEASHVVEVALDNGRIEVLHQAGDFAETSFSLGYALTVHKAQGCEWRKVIILLHKNHLQMLTRELLYTAITRASEYCIIVDLCNTVDKAISNQRMKGDTVQEKIEWFNSEISLNEPFSVVP